ncbi:MAG: Spy/CpxP family protein refolding chaperone [Rhodoferax sp.]
MKTWIKRTLIGALGVSLFAGGLTAWGWHGRHGGEWSAERIAEVRGKVVGTISDKLVLDATQKQKLELLADQLLAARTAVRGTQPDPRTEMQALISGAQFDRSRAQSLLDQKTQAVQGSGPKLIAAFADFYDSLNPQQQQQVRERLQHRRPSWWHQG